MRKNDDWRKRVGENENKRNERNKHKKSTEPEKWALQDSGLPSQEPAGSFGESKGLQPFVFVPHSSGIDLRGRPFAILMFTAAVFAALPGVEGAPSGKSEKPIRKKQPVQASGQDPIVEVEIPVLPADAPDVSSVRYFKADSSKPPKEKKLMENEALLARLMSEVIDINPYYQNQARGKGLSLKKATELLQKALPVAISASGALPALQALEGSGRKLKISFIAEEDLATAGLNSESRGQYGLAFIPGEVAMPGRILLSMKTLRGEPLSAIFIVLANELAHFRSSLIHYAASIPSFPYVSFEDESENYTKIKLQPWVDNREKKALQLAIIQGLEAFWKFDQSRLKKIFLDQERYLNFANFLIRITAYKLPVITSFIEKMKKQLTGDKKQYFDILLESVELRSKNAMLKAYAAKNLDGQLTECDSDVASLIAAVPQEEQKALKEAFRAWFSYHEQQAQKYFPKPEAASELEKDSIKLGL